ncbi:MAG: TIR domain-containing protein [Chloroflexi bacterium]|nr:TIR domain-containing protein [Chloroflexota bacterium]
MSQIFISYSRKDLKLARPIVYSLTQDDLDVWIDWEDIPKGEEFYQKIYQGIEESDIFLFLISPDSVHSEWCNNEIAHAVKNGKRILPIVIRDTDPGVIHPEISKRNWIFCRDGQDNFTKAIQEIQITIHTDYEWVQIHRRLQVRALEWERNHQENSFLLRGRDLRDAEAQLSANVSKDPKPTALQTQYALKSRQSEIRRQRNLLSGVGIALVMSVGLGILAFINGQNATRNANNFATQVVIARDEANFRATEQARAEEQTRIALSRSLISASRLNFEKQYDLSLLMAVEARQLDDSIPAKAALFDSLENIPMATKFVDLGFQIDHPGYINRPGGVLDFSRDGRYLAAHAAGPDIYIIDMKSSDSKSSIKLSGHLSNIMALQFASAKDELYSIDDGGIFISWDTRTWQLQKQIPIPMKFNEELYAMSTPMAAISKVGDLVAIVNYDETYIWNVTTNSLFQTILPGMALGGMPIEIVAFSPDGRMVAAGAFYKAVAWDAATGQQIPNGDISTARPVTALAISPDGSIFAAGSSDGFVHIMNLETGEERSQPPASYGVDITTGQEVTTDISGHKDNISGLAFSLDSQTLLSASNDQTLIGWDAGHWPILEPIDVHHQPIIGIAFSPASNNVMSSIDVTGTVIVWDISRTSRLFDFTDEFDFSQDLLGGEQLASEDCDRMVKQTGSSCFVSPNGKIMISFYLQEAYGAYANARTQDAIIEIWDFEARQLIGQHPVSAFEPEAVAYSADHKYARILGNSFRGAFLLFNIDFLDWVDMACATANRDFSTEEWSLYLGDMSYRPACQK